MNDFIYIAFYMIYAHKYVYLLHNYISIGALNHVFYNPRKFALF